MQSKISISNYYNIYIWVSINDHPYSKHSGYLLFFEITIMWKTADLVMIQKTNIDTLHKEGNSQRVITETECVSKHVIPNTPEVICIVGIFYQDLQQKDILNRNVRLLNSMFISMPSILGWASPWMHELQHQCGVEIYLKKNYITQNC